MSIDICPVCGTTPAEPLFTLRGVPVVCNQLWPDVTSARAAPVGDIKLVLCPACGLIWNRDFDPERVAYTPGYENALHFSPSFRDFAEDLARGLVARHHLAGRRLLEIGCGDGYMLDKMVKHGVATATGFDPSMQGRETPYASREGVEIVPEHCPLERLEGHFDAIVCRHVLEHLAAPADFLAKIRRAAGKRGIPIYVETPNADWMLDQVSIWDVIYEHATYWTVPTMEVLFRRAGFLLARLEPGYGGQFLMAEGIAAEPDPGWSASAVSEVLTGARAFSRKARAEIQRWRARLGALKTRAVVWGAGSKGITFLNAVGPLANELSAFVDLNPRKHGLFAPGVALPVIRPEALVDLRPELVLVSNARYLSEVSAMIRSMGLETTIDTIAGWAGSGTSAAPQRARARSAEPRFG